MAQRTPTPTQRMEARREAARLVRVQVRQRGTPLATIADDLHIDVATVRRWSEGSCWPSYPKCEEIRRLYGESRL